MYYTENSGKNCKNYFGWKMKSYIQKLRTSLIADKLKRLLKANSTSNGCGLNGSGSQDLDVYWDPAMAQILETWGIDNVWNEIQFLMANCNGKVLDIACGTGKTMSLLSKFTQIDVYGFDISDLLISKALERGIAAGHLLVEDATKMTYGDKSFDYAYSIGSLEHFTEDGILKFISECQRVVRVSSMHQIPVSRSGNNEGWIRTNQSYYNNSIQWWLEKFERTYQTVYVLDSAWEDKRSVGKWFVCK